MSCVSSRFFFLSCLQEKLNIVYEPKQLNGASDLFNSEDEEALKKIALQYEEKYVSYSFVICNILTMSFWWFWFHDVILTIALTYLPIVASDEVSILQGGGSNMRYQTYTELGAGYDENDSFIDNTEAVSWAHYISCLYCSAFLN